MNSIIRHSKGDGSLYLEGSTDLAILRAFAKKLRHPVVERVGSTLCPTMFGDQPGKAREHFYALREAKPNLVGFCLFDRIAGELQTHPELREYAWERREIENYIVFNKQVLIDWTRAEAMEHAHLFMETWISTMENTIKEIEDALVTLGKGTPWSAGTKVSTDFLEPLFAAFFKKLGLPNLMQKNELSYFGRTCASAANRS